MSTPFDPLRGLVVIPATLTGPAGVKDLRLALDTGAVSTVLNDVSLTAVGYDPIKAKGRTLMTTAMGAMTVPRIIVRSLSALGKTRVDFPVLCRTIPPAPGIDGVLGLRLLRGLRLVVDFRTGMVELT